MMVKKNGFRDGVDKEKLMKSMTDGDWKRVAAQKELQSVNPGSISYNVLLANDVVRRKIKLIKERVNKRFLDILNTENTIVRKKVQIESGVVHDELKPGLKMTKEELELEVEYANHLKDSQAKDVVTDLADLRGMVGVHDAARKVVLTEEEYDEYVGKIERRIKKHGYELFDN